MFLTKLRMVDLQQFMCGGGGLQMGLQCAKVSRHLISRLFYFASKEPDFLEFLREIQGGLKVGFQSFLVLFQ